MLMVLKHPRLQIFKVTSPTKMRNHGYIELFIALPIFCLLGWGIALLGLNLIQKSKLEQSAWVYGMARSHKTTKSKSLKEASLVFGLEEKPQNFSVEEGRDCSMEFLGEMNKLPLVFKTFLLKSCSNKVELSVLNPIPIEVSAFLKASGLDDKNQNLKHSTMVVSKGDDFKNSMSLKHALWQEAMLEVGFGYLPLQLLAVPELSRAAGIVGWAKLGEVVSKLVQNL